MVTQSFHRTTGNYETRGETSTLWDRVVSGIPLEVRTQKTIKKRKLGVKRTTRELNKMYSSHDVQDPIILSTLTRDHSCNWIRTQYSVISRFHISVSHSQSASRLLATVPDCLTMHSAKDLSTHFFDTNSSLEFKSTSANANVNATVAATANANGSGSDSGSVGTLGDYLGHLEVDG